MDVATDNGYGLLATDTDVPKYAIMKISTLNIYHEYFALWIRDSIAEWLLLWCDVVAEKKTNWKA